ncbi:MULTISPECIES: EamA family transporter [unclassified Aeromicrobium]|uniref:EamA family transporter n=1 Tax=unclassified Aeromicrobium TaxID=2633570 RepID=UPI00396B14BB
MPGREPLLRGGIRALPAALADWPVRRDHDCCQPDHRRCAPRAAHRPFVGGLAPVQLKPSVLWSMLALGLLSTGIVYVWHAQIIHACGAASGSTVIYVTPVVGVVLGVVLLGEALHRSEPAGGLLIMIGVLVSQGLGIRVFRPVRPIRES